eukprot:TRINITY_DN773_c0_g1_i1.p1 TRINITY_DN773_c0_g1~~TRINITY_DN773_c0_g1_i1.p1  ORF type:complete len:172 (+),score=27.50 TRINITY_DN773_c0_g1_i1:242-757(+)
MGNKGAKLKLQKEWDKCKGQIDAPVLRKMFQLYDRDRDGVLMKNEAMQFVADLILVSGMENEVLKEMPIFKDEKGYLTEFVEVIVCDLAGVPEPRTDVTVSVDMFLSHGINYQKFISDKCKTWSHAAKKEEEMIQERIRQGRRAMMSFEYEETLASLEARMTKQENMVCAL